MSRFQRLRLQWFSVWFEEGGWSYGEFQSSANSLSAGMLECEVYLRGGSAKP